jgi:hypothetical protein
MVQLSGCDRAGADRNAPGQVGPTETGWLSVEAIELHKIGVAEGQIEHLIYLNHETGRGPRTQRRATRRQEPGPGDTGRPGSSTQSRRGQKAQPSPGRQPSPAPAASPAPAGR